MTTALIIRAEDRPIWLCFEPWSDEFTVPPDSAVMISFPDDKVRVEVTPHPEGIIFFSLGPHPDIYTETGEPVAILSTVAPDIPDVAIEALRLIMRAVPPIRSDNVN